MNAPLLQAKNPCEIEGRNFRRGYREPAIGKVYTIQFEVDKDLWDACELIPKTATVKGVMWWEAEAVEPEQEAKRNGSKGEYGGYWRLLRIPHNDICNWPDLQEVLNCERDQVWERLHEAFDTSTMATVSPSQFEDWANSKGLHSLITLSRQVRAKLQDIA